MKKIEPIILKGTRDFLPTDMAKRNFVMNKIRTIFERFGYDAIETPIICPAETILGKYVGENTRLTYSFDDNGGRRIALPFDLTVPFARFFAAHYQDLPQPFKRYQIQRVWRAERPQKGRLREFYQCDVDIIGTRSLIAEAEIAKIVYEVFKDLGFSNFVIKFNTRRLMNAVLEKFSLPAEKIVDVIRIIDKLDKLSKKEILQELSELGIQKIESEKILSLLTPEDTLQKTLEKFVSYDTSEIQEFIQYCDSLEIPQQYLLFDPSLARGLDYYTGIIYEITSTDVNFGTLCAGGRYDNLCGLFCDEDFSGVGVAFGFERLMIVLEELGMFKDINLSAKVLVTLFDNNSKADALSIYAELIRAGINSELYLETDKLGKQLKYADKKRIPFAIIRGDEERSKEEVMIKSMNSGKQKTIPLKQLITYLSGYYESK